jgi:RNA polymerase sigma-70 factor (ECF subfamily)
MAQSVPPLPDASSLADLAALGDLLESNRPRLLAMVQRRLDPALARRVSAEDVLAQAFLAVRHRWPAFRAQNELAPYPWLYRQVLDCLWETWRRESRACRDLQRDLPWPDQSSLQLGLSLIAPGTSPSQALARKEVQQQVRQALDALKAADREILWMRHFDQLAFKEIAQVVGATPGAANLRYVRALERLKELCRHLDLDGSVR